MSKRKKNLNNRKSKKMHAMSSAQWGKIFNSDCKRNISMCYLEVYFKITFKFYLKCFS